MDPTLVQVASFGSTIEADAARVALEHQGISAFLDGAAAGNALGYVGTALGGVRLLVSSDDASRAAEVIAALEPDESADKTPWYCGVCREEVETGFAICWSCGKERSEVEAQRPDDSIPPAKPIHGDDEPTNMSRLVNESPASDLNPYRSPTTAQSALLEKEEGELAEDPETEAMILRAWRASILGIVFCPFVLQLYSMVLLLRASRSDIRLSKKSTRRFYQALAINIVVGCAEAVAMWWLL